MRVNAVDLFTNPDVLERESVMIVPSGGGRVHITEDTCKYDKIQLCNSEFGRGDAGLRW